MLPYPSPLLPSSDLSPCPSFKITQLFSRPLPLSVPTFYRPRFPLFPFLSIFLSMCVLPPSVTIAIPYLILLICASLPTPSTVFHLFFFFITEFPLLPHTSHILNSTSSSPSIYQICHLSFSPIPLSALTLWPPLPPLLLILLLLQPFCSSHSGPPGDRRRHSPPPVH